MSDDSNLSLAEMVEQERSASETPEAPPDDTEPTTPDALETAEETPSPEDTEDDSPSDETPPSTNREVIDWFLSQGEEWAGKYSSNAELLRSLPHLQRKLRERDEDAVWARKFTPEQRAQLESLASGQQQPQQPLDDDPRPAVTAEDEHRAEFDPNCPVDIRQKVQNLYKWKLRQADPDRVSALIEKRLEQMLADRLKGVEEQTGKLAKTFEQREFESQLSAWTNQHATDLLDANGNWTPLAEEAGRLLNTNEDCRALREAGRDISAHNLALTLAKSKVPPTKSTKPVPKSAIREPAIATGEGSPRDAIEAKLAKIDEIEDLPGNYAFANILSELAKLEG